MRFLSVFALIILLGSCAQLEMPMYVKQIVKRVQPEMTEHDVYVGDPVFLRIFKEENVLELWMKPEKSTRFTLVKTYPICHWSGRLGPKITEGDLQAPEGFYATDFNSLNPNSQYHLSFNVQYPNAYDQAHGRTGSYIMVHGDCVSEGCFAMTDLKMEELYILSERALLAGQNDIPIHIFPFRMTPQRLRLEFASPNYPFWYNLKEGYDYFETHGTPPMWIVRNKQYEFY